MKGSDALFIFFFWKKVKNNLIFSFCYDIIKEGREVILSCYKDKIARERREGGDGYVAR